MPLTFDEWTPLMADEKHPGSAPLEAPKIEPPHGAYSLHRVPDALGRGDAYMASAGVLLIRISRPVSPRFGRSGAFPEVQVVPTDPRGDALAIQPAMIVAGPIRAIVGESLEIQVLDGRERMLRLEGSIEWIARESIPLADAFRVHARNLDERRRQAWVRRNGEA
jgi:hypothetical protein